jgi:DNA-binding CsgD family transcriptional regulator
MLTRKLSPREEEIVGLCVEGLTNEAIAIRLGLSMGTINTYWLRIKLKVGGSGKTNTVVKIIKEKAELALREENVERKRLNEMVVEKERGVIELRAALALLQLATEQIKSTVWATDTHLRINILANGVFPSTHFGVTWEVGKTVYEIFKTEDPKSLAVAAHLSALDGKESEGRLEGEFSNMILRVTPLADEAGDVIGCIGILNSVGG